MQPKIALIFCFAYVIFLFRIEGRKRIDVSNALWIPLIWIMYCGSRAVSYWLYPETFMASENNNVADGNPVDRIFLIGLIVSGMLVLWRRKINWQEIIGKNKWILVLFLYLGLSVLWSDYMDVSFKRWVRAIGDIIMVLIVVTENNPLVAIQRLLLRCSFVLIPLSVVLVKYYHASGVCYNAVTGTTMWIGVTTHKNQLGQLATVSAVNAMWQLMNKWRHRDVSFYNIAGIFLMSLWLLKGPEFSNSKTSILISMIGFSILLISNIFKNRPQYLGRLILFCGLLFIALQTASEALFGESFIELIVMSAGRDMTFTGRTALWGEILRIGANHPILGVGYGGFWIGDQHHLWEKFQWIPESAHNGYLDVYLDLGIIGFMILCGVIISVYNKSAKMTLSNYEYGRIGLTFFIMILIYNITESSLIKSTNLLWYLFLLFGLRGYENIAYKSYANNKDEYIKKCQQSIGAILLFKKTDMRYFKVTKRF